MTRTAWTTTGVAAAAVALAVALSGSRSAPARETDVVRAQVRTTLLEPRRLARVARAGGFFRARLDVTVSAEREGRVVALPVAEGKGVREGEVVARLDATVAEADLRAAHVAARETELRPTAPAAELARAREALRIAEHEVRLRLPVAPTDGVVEVHHVEVGEYVRPGMPLVDVLDDTVLVLDVDVDADVVGEIEPGDAPAVEVPALGAMAVPDARVTRVAGRADPSTRRFRVEVSVPAGGGLRPGMWGEARFEVGDAGPALYLPKAAVTELRGQRGVFVVAGGRARWTPVDVAEVFARPGLWRLPGDTPANRALAGGAVVVVEGFSGLRDGAAVEVAR